MPTPTPQGVLDQNYQIERANTLVYKKLKNMNQVLNFQYSFHGLEEKG